MGSVVADPVAPAPVVSARLVGVGVVVFLANAGSLVLQLVAGRLLSPFVGSSLETWTAIIGAFLVGIAAGNAVGGKAADRRAGGRRLAAFLSLGGLSALWMLGLPLALDATGLHRVLPLAVRIPVLAAALCLPAGFSLSLLTPMAIRLGIPDVRHAGRVAGMVFALGTLGCLAGNYLTGWVLIPNLTVNAIVGTTALLLFGTAAGAVFLGTPNGEKGSEGEGEKGSEGEPENGFHSSPPHLLTTSPPLPIRKAYLIVFLASFAGMTLELAAARLLAQILGVSLYTWTGVIGVMLAGTAIGNWLGGVIADRAGKSDDPDAARRTLAGSLILACCCGVYVLIAFMAAVRAGLFADFGIVGQVLAWTFTLFFPAMLALGTISPQVIRLAVPDVAHVGRVAGRVYAWSTVGAIAGTFAAGFVLVSQLGMFRTVIVAAALPGVAAVVVGSFWNRAALLYPLSLAFGGVLASLIVFHPGTFAITRETNYYTIAVHKPSDKEVEADGYPADGLKLDLDHLTHSMVRPSDPTYLFYPHEQIQMEFLRRASAEHPDGPKVLVVGGGGYTFPRCARTLVPSSAVDVVEIDPGVTAVSYSHLGLDPNLNIASYHMDGRQFVAEKAAAGHYHLITLDAVNDLSVPAHLLTREFNEQVKRCLTPDGVYLLTVIDVPDGGRLWAAAVHTLRETFPHVELLISSATNLGKLGDQQVMVIYASTRPLDLDRLRAELAKQKVTSPFTHQLPPADLAALLGKRRPLVLTDQFAPVDNLMAPVFRQRKMH